jgi:hypothetical protein
MSEVLDLLNLGTNEIARGVDEAADEAAEQALLACGGWRGVAIV